jgi:hypothetical protein
MRNTIWLGLVVVAGCAGDAGYAPHIDPAKFSATIDNPLMPLVPGTVFAYHVDETGEDDTQTVLSDTTDVGGVTCRVVHDVATIDGTVTEDTYDWYAQDDDGAVWYLGEDTTEYDGSGGSSTEGSWAYGTDDAQPGIIVEADPQVGDTYRQEYLAGEAEDQGEVLDLDASITVPYGAFDHCMQTKDFSELEPDVVENKWYCPDVGVVAARTVVGAPETENLVSVTGP